MLDTHVGDSAATCLSLNASLSSPAACRSRVPAQPTPCIRPTQKGLLTLQQMPGLRKWGPLLLSEWAEQGGLRKKWGQQGGPSAPAFPLGHLNVPKDSAPTRRSRLAVPPPPTPAWRLLEGSRTESQRLVPIPFLGHVAGRVVGVHCGNRPFRGSVGPDHVGLAPCRPSDPAWSSWVDFTGHGTPPTHP